MEAGSVRFRKVNKIGFGFDCRGLRRVDSIYHFRGRGRGGDVGCVSGSIVGQLID